MQIIPGTVGLYPTHMSLFLHTIFMKVHYHHFTYSSSNVILNEKTL